MFAIVNKAKDYIQEQAEIRLKTLNISEPQDFIEAFLVKMLEVENTAWSSHWRLNLLHIMKIWNVAGIKIPSMSTYVSLAIMSE